MEKMNYLSAGSSRRGLGGGVSFEALPTWVPIVVFVVALVITIIVFVTIVEKKKAPRGRFARWLREFLNFRSILIAGIIKFVYLFSATLLTISGFVVMTQGRGDGVLAAIGIGFAMIVFGNILLRIMMEMTMIMIGLWQNTSDMRAVIVKGEERPEEEEPEVKKPAAPVVTETTEVVEVAEKK